VSVDTNRKYGSLAVDRGRWLDAPILKEIKLKRIGDRPPLKETKPVSVCLYATLESDRPYGDRLGPIVDDGQHECLTHQIRRTLV
jgi:hypothetical protein